MQLSIRLKAVAELAKDAAYLADVGTDHGYLPIYLAAQGQLVHAIAMDVNAGPLLRAQENIRRHHLEDVIETRLSDGVAKLKPKEADTVVLAGMGGALAIKILKEGEKTLALVDTLVLQPQSEIALVRRFLHAQGYAVTQEKMVKDEGKYYPMMKAVHGRQEPWEEEEYLYGRQLIREKNPCLLEYLEKEERTLNQIAASLKGQPGENIRKREATLRAQLAQIEKTKRRMA